MQLKRTGGKQWVVSGGEEYFLPKSTAAINHTTLETIGEDNKFLVFEQSAGGTEFKLVSERFYPKSTRIDTDVKRPYHESIGEFYDWMLTMAPLLRPDATSTGGATQLISAMLDRYGSYHLLGVRHQPRILMQAGIITSPEEEWANYREVISNTYHPARPALAMFILDVCGYWDIDRVSVPHDVRRWDSFTRQYITHVGDACSQEELKDEMRRFRQRYVSRINKLCGFIKIVTKGE